MIAGAAAKTFKPGLPWWGSAVVGMVIVIVFTLPMASRLGTVGGRNYGWYTSHHGRLLTGLILDQVQYTRMVDHTADRAPSSKVAPFTNRALAPWIAGKLPFDAFTALTIVNVAALTLGTFALALLAMDLTRSRGATLIAVLVWAVSLPVLRYTGAAFVDAAAVGLIPVVLLCLWRRWTIPALALFAAAIWMKETALMVLPVVLAFEWMQPANSHVRRILTSFMWVLTAIAAYVTAGIVGGGDLIVFAPWIPGSFTIAKRVVLWNTLTAPRLIAFGLTVAPAVFAVSMWWKARRRNTPLLAQSDAVPLVVGCAAGTLIALAAIPSATFDGRSVWTTLAPAALLIAAWVTARDRRSAVADIWGFARVGTPVLGVAAALWVALVLTVPLPLDAEVLGDDYHPRFTAVPTQPEQQLVRELSGEGTKRIEVPGESPVLVEFDSQTPITLRAEGADAIESDGATRGVALFDPQDGRTLEISADEPWSILIRPVASALFWDSISPVSGDGPNVLVFPGGLPRGGTSLSWRSSDPDARVRLVGACHLGTCGELQHEDIIPAGTEALVIDTDGAWSMLPDADADSDQPRTSSPVLEGTVTEDPGEADHADQSGATGD